MMPFEYQGRLHQYTSAVLLSIIHLRQERFGIWENVDFIK